MSKRFFLLEERACQTHQGRREPPDFTFTDIQTGDCGGFLTVLHDIPRFDFCIFCQFYGAGAHAALPFHNFSVFLENSTFGFGRTGKRAETENFRTGFSKIFTQQFAGDVAVDDDDPAIGEIIFYQLDLFGSPPEIFRFFIFQQIAQIYDAELFVFFRRDGAGSVFPTVSADEIIQHIAGIILVAAC